MPPRRRFFFFFAKTSSASSVTKRTTGFSIVGDRRGLVGHVVARRNFTLRRRKNEGNGSAPGGLGQLRKKKKTEQKKPRKPLPSTK